MDVSHMFSSSGLAPTFGFAMENQSGLAPFSATTSPPRYREKENVPKVAVDWANTSNIKLNETYLSFFLSELIADFFF